MSLEKLKIYYEDLYGTNGITSFRYGQLMDIVEKAKKERSEDLKKQDIQGNSWYLSEKMVGMMLYIDKFSKDLTQLENKIDYFSELGITYIHFMPLLKTREKNNDGGYAVVDYLNVDKRFGTTDQFKRIIKKLKKKGIRSCIDFVLNHTAKEHEWALKSKVNTHDYEDMYFMFDTDEVPNAYERNLTQIFPEVAPNNFTYYDDIKKYVMTRFYEFQWDLNYKNPQVFNKIAEVLLGLANMGIDIFRLDAIPYMWKQLGTSSMNLPQVHTLLRMYHMLVEEVCPSVIFKGEAIVEPHEIVKYFGVEEEKECHIMYNASLMVLLWNSLATRDVRLMQRSINIDYGTPKDGVWINYARCHDDIGWGFEENILKELKLDPMTHKQFIIQFMEGKFPGSFAKGELYEFNPITLDARNSGTMASLCGLEKALEEKNEYQIELSLKRILLLNSIIISYTGIPMLYSGDEIGTLNYWDYKKQDDTKGDSRWLHRPPIDWKKAEKRKDASTIEGFLFQKIKRMIAIRKSNPLFASSLHSEAFDTWNKGVFGFNKENKMVVLANFTEHEQTIDYHSMDRYQMYGIMTDILQGKQININQNIILGPYEFLWLVW